MRNTILLAVLILITLSTFAQKKPNIVLLFVDDLGWADIGFRNKKLHTPNIDLLKDEGLDFSRAYISTPTCSPSRASILTGKEPIRMKMVRHIPNDPKHGGDKDGRMSKEFSLWAKDPVQMPTRNWLPLEEITYAERLKELGYYNAFMGKWHLGHEKYHPTAQGFDEQYGTSNWGHPKSYYAPFFKANNPLKSSAKGEYLTDVLTLQAEKFIQDYDKEKPFMLSMWYYNVHGPHVGRKDWLEKYKKEGLEGKYAEYAAMISAMDESVGRIRKSLKTKGIADNTVIIFTSDQGGAFKNAHLRGGKKGGFTLCEGGARVPFIVYYPGATKASAVSNVPVQTIDIYPTVVEIASGKKCKDKQINGKSLLPIIQGKKFKKRKLFFFRSYEDQRSAVIEGNWKLIRYHSGAFELFNLKKDEGEQNNLFDKATKQATRLKKALAKWESEVQYHRPEQR